MTKRRVSNKQTARIKKNQSDYLASDNVSKGLVITQYGKQAEVEDLQGRRLCCVIRPHLETLVAGDHVLWQQEGENQGVVVSVCPRRSVLAKPTLHGLTKPVAANLTQIVIVVAVQPEINWPLLDSYLIMSELLQLQSVIVLNKVDLPSSNETITLLENYQPLKYPIVFTENLTSQGLDTLKPTLDQQISVIVGQSGVGKSSIVNHLLSTSGLETPQTFENVRFGKHTTSYSRYFHLPQGGAVIDSPGVRRFRLWNIDTRQLVFGYKEFRLYVSSCKFRNCNHIDTVGCAVREAVQHGKISSLRYSNFLKLSTQL